MENIQTAQLSLPPGMIEFGAGQPSPSLLPLKLLREAAANRLGNDDASYLAYGAEQGDGYFRKILAEYLSEQYRMPVDGLYLCGAGTHPGGGVSGAAGRNAARAILRREKAA